MATDVKESDTDERPAPPKRQCTRVNKERVEEPPAEESEYDEAERLAREKLTVWQQCQLAKAFLDNAVNGVVDDFNLNRPLTNSVANDFRLFRSTEMEDTAVTMAIRNHGLVNSTPRVLPASWSADEGSDRLSGDENLPSSSFAIGETETRRVDSSSWTEEKLGADNEQDFMERAVVEAIKKKGLSALTVPCSPHFF